MPATSSGRAPTEPRRAVVAFVLAAWVLGSSAAWGSHPGSDANCRRCHEYGRGAAGIAKVVPPQPGWFGTLLGKKPTYGHAAVPCAGVVLADGRLSGCHRPETGSKGFLVQNLSGRPSDEFCGQCHAGQRKPGAHHPTYKSDKNGDGVAETLVRPFRTQQVFTLYAPRLWPEPLRSHPDALSYRDAPAGGAKVREVVLPLETVTEWVDGKPVAQENVLTCTTCHNPHHGYLAGRELEENLPAKQASRRKGDALLRMRDFDNVLCLACH